MSRIDHLPDKSRESLVPTLVKLRLVGWVIGDAVSNIRRPECPVNRLSIASAINRDLNNPLTNEQVRVRTQSAWDKLFHLIHPKAPDSSEVVTALSQTICYEYNPTLNALKVGFDHGGDRYEATVCATGKTALTITPADGQPGRCNPNISNNPHFPAVATLIFLNSVALLPDTIPQPEILPDPSPTLVSSRQVC